MSLPIKNYVGKSHCNHQPRSYTFVENTISNLSKVARTKFQGSNPFAMINSMSEFHFRRKRFNLFVQMKEVLFVSYGSSTSSLKSWR